ncbi:hypothetical protein Pyn_20959 [Prunus yedoensis var. nudiflora]|uniref:Uncharacterized protein n=1 Tax=Prunus yedoensis var. nudiflora TaxID=2094558 RepID=A0A314UFM1_PRUYE|nr:hypothetical protein Pyn_20959 [Prunus yedoensis var. nudiflora]
MAKSDEGKKVGAPAGLIDGIPPCVLIPFGSLKDFCLELALKPPSSPFTCGFPTFLCGFVFKLSARSDAALLF